MDDDIVRTRLRLVFEDRHMLCKLQRKQGLRRSWVLLKRDHHTISDLASHLLRVFHLEGSCPNGLILSMDGFVLPPFESAFILKDKDIVEVKRKHVSSADLVKLRDTEGTLPEIEFAEKQPLNTGLRLLANEEFEKESGGYETEPEEDEHEQSMHGLTSEPTSNGNAVSKKRKASKKLQSSKTKKSKLANAEELPETCGCVDDIPVEKQRVHEDEALLKRATTDKSDPSSRKVNAGQDNPDKLGSPENDLTTSPIAKSQPLQDCKGSVDASDSPCQPKLPSRSARRKKAKRQWLRELRKIGNKEVDERTRSFRKDHQQLLAKDGCASSKERGQQHQSCTSAQARQPHDRDNCADDNIVPVVIRPGHIRFEPLDEDVDHTVQKIQVSPAFEWNGIKSKKKGQKWGKEKAGAWKWADNKNLDQEHTQEPSVVEQIPLSDVGDFDKLAPYGSSPQEGDIVAYRVIELSSSWCPELTSFRVGKISSYHQESNKVTLVPVPEYPLDLESVDKTLYREDGFLEVDFASFVDIRVVKHADGKPNPAEPAVGGVEVSVGDQNAIESLPVNSNDEATKAITADNNDKATTPARSENGPVNAWEEITKALSEKKAQLSQQDNWKRKESSGRSSWSYKALRGSALGPTMAILRAQNGI